ncbi:MAG: AMP-binding protein [Planctomycetes bacterium]|nr:AMP-binding protein [Planctomycetota bacterium]
MNATDRFLRARDFLLANREDYAAAYSCFRWPEMGSFNWALDYFDVIAKGNDRPGLWVVDEAGETQLSFAELGERSNRAANLLRKSGVERGDVILTLLPNVPQLWEITLAAMKLGAVISPAAPLLTADDVLDRIERGRIRHIITDAAGSLKCDGVPNSVSRILVGAQLGGWTAYEEVEMASPAFNPDRLTRPDDPLLLYFTSGTTAKPKMVLHTHRSYPVGHLSTMYWIGLKPGDVHYNISSPGWAKQAWSSFFAPWNAGATVFVFNQTRFDAKKTLSALVKHQVTTLCAPPTVWRMLILEDLAAYPVKLREVVSAGEPLNPEVIERVHKAWGTTIRDGYGQTETTALAGNSPGQAVKPGSMGRPLPGYNLALLDAAGVPAEEGEISVTWDRLPACPESGQAGSLPYEGRPAGLMAGYVGCAEPTAEDCYRTCDVATRDADGYLWYVGRADDVFKSSDYRISPFEIESALLEHESVAEAAVVPSPDPVRLNVPKAFIVLKPGIDACRDTALSIFRFLRERLAPYQRVRRLEFAELPKTISGKIRRVELRAREMKRGSNAERLANEYREGDLAEV